MCRCLRSSRRRRKSQGLRLLSIVKNGVNCQGSIIKLKVVLATELLILSCTFVNIAIESFCFHFGDINIAMACAGSY